MNFKVRFKNPVFIAQLILAILTPILVYANLTVQDITSWAILGNVLFGAIKNPYVLGTVVVNVWNALNDPTTAGLSDSTKALEYTAPRKD